MLDREMASWTSDKYRARCRAGLEKLLVLPYEELSGQHHNPYPCAHPHNLGEGWGGMQLHVVPIQG